MMENSSESKHQSQPSHVSAVTVEHLRAEVETLKERERQIVELLGADSPERILHDLRNLLNEVQLLRLVVSDEKA